MWAEKLFGQTTAMGSGKEARLKGLGCDGGREESLSQKILWKNLCSGTRVGKKRRWNDLCEC